MASLHIHSSDLDLVHKLLDATINHRTSKHSALLTTPLQSMHNIYSSASKLKNQLESWHSLYAFSSIAFLLVWFCWHCDRFWQGYQLMNYLRYQER